MSEAEQESAEKMATAETPREKASFAPVAVLAIVFTPLAVIASVFFSQSENRTFYPPESNEINVGVILSAPQFLQFNRGNVCDGSGPLARLSSATVQIGATGWSKKTILGEGNLNAQGNCEYGVSVIPPDNFSGGEISAKILFSFGESENFTINVGDSMPYQKKNLAIRLG